MLKKRDKVVIDPKKLINMFLNEEPEEVLYNSIDIKFDNIDTVTLMFVEILLKNKFIKLKEYNDDTKIAKFNALNLVKLENSIYYINKIHQYYSGNYDNELVVNIEDFEKNIEINSNESYEYVYSLTAYYEYLIEVKKSGCYKAIRKLFSKKKQR